MLKNFSEYCLKKKKEHSKYFIQLQSSVQQLSFKPNELERYNSKDSVIFDNLPLGITGTLIRDVSYFCSKVLNMSVTEDNIKACHPLYPVKDFNRPPPTIAKFIRFDKKNSPWNRKPLLRNFVSPCNNKPVYIIERLSKHASGLEIEAELRDMIVSTWNSTPFVKIKDIGGKFESVKVDTMEELEGLSNTAVSKVNTIRSAKAHSEVLYTKVLKDNISPAKKRFRFQVAPSPASTTNEEMQTLKSELVKHMDNDNALLDFIKGLVGGKI